jgi:hypothetical protein
LGDELLATAGVPATLLIFLSKVHFNRHILGILPGPLQKQITWWVKEPLGEKDALWDFFSCAL